MNFPCRFVGRAAGSPTGDPVLLMTKIITNVYIDGFNFYYGCVKNTSYKWLDFSKFCSLLFQQHTINRIRYFTARIQTIPGASLETNKRIKASIQRQSTYLRALKTIPNLSIHEGYFQTKTTQMPLTSPIEGYNKKLVAVEKTEEKGTDVNIATYLLIDGFKRDYEMAIVISNDADLVEPIKLVKSELNLRIGIRHPYFNNHVSELSQVAEFYKPISEGILKASQFPPVLSDAAGRITKPAQW